MRIHQLSKELGIPTNKLLLKAKQLNLNIKSPLSNLDEKAIAQLRKEFARKSPPEIATQKKGSFVPVPMESCLGKGATRIKQNRRKPAQPEPPDKKIIELPAAETEPNKKEAILAQLIEAPPSDTKTIRALRSTELDYYDKETVEQGKGFSGKIVEKRVAVKAKPFIKKTFFFKKKPTGPSQTLTPTKPLERKVIITGKITLRELSERIGIKADLIIKKLIGHDIMVQINDYLSEDALILIGLEFDYEIIHEKPKDITSQIIDVVDKPQDLKQRGPVVTFMGHIDHGKTSLIDKIRTTSVATTEAGAITQHLGSYEVVVNDKKMVILDTPGHEAFTRMRARGANITDIVVLVVAADDGVMPQTEEAISHAKAANTPIIVAINKVDKPNINIHKVKRQLSALDITPEEWGGKNIFVEVSALTGQEINHLLEMILLQAEIMELKANPSRRAYGTVLEAKLTESQGHLVTLLIQNGTLRIADPITCGSAYGRVRAIFDSNSKNITQAAPATLAKIIGLSCLPMAGDRCYVVDSIQTASKLAEIQKHRQKETPFIAKHITLENIFEKLSTTDLKEIRVVLKTDVQGSLEVIGQLLNNFSYKEAKIKIIHKGVGHINESDILLADASDAIVIGFNIPIEERAKALSNDYGIEIKTYNVIYSIVEDMKLALEGLLEPEEVEVKTGRLAVKNIFKISRLGNIAGCLVQEGRIERTSLVKIYRDKNLVFTGKLSSLKRLKDDAREVNEGFECGLKIDGFNDINIGDIIETYQKEKRLKKLTSLNLT
jgi:translation initiation factor IF-2